MNETDTRDRGDNSSTGGRMEGQRKICTKGGFHARAVNLLVSLILTVVNPVPDVTIGIHYSIHILYLCIECFYVGTIVIAVPPPVHDVVTAVSRLNAESQQIHVQRLIPDPFIATHIIQPWVFIADIRCSLIVGDSFSIITPQTVDIHVVMLHPVFTAFSELLRIQRIFFIRKHMAPGMVALVIALPFIGLSQVFGSQSQVVVTPRKNVSLTQSPFFLA